MDLYRTPDAQFADLPDFGWKASYAEVSQPDGETGAALRMGYIDAGPADGPVALLLHGEPTWSFLYRHVEWVRELVFDRLDLNDVTLVGQDWGGLIGLRLVAENPDRFARVVAANTGLPTGDYRMPDIWWTFREAVERAESLDVGRFVESGCVRGLAAEDRAAYDAPFPVEESKAGPRV